MERKKEDIETRLRQIQRLLKDNTSILEQDPPVQAKQNRQPILTLQPSELQNRPHKPTIVEPTSLRSQLAQIKCLLMQTVNGQRKIESELSEIRRWIAGSSQIATYSSRTQEQSLLQNQPSQRYY